MPSQGVIHPTSKQRHAGAGELLCIGWSFNKPHAHFFRVDRDGWLQVDVPIDLPEPVFMHDMAFTKASLTASLFR